MKAASDGSQVAAACMAVLRLAWCLSTRPVRPPTSAHAGNFCIWQRGCRRSGRISLAWSQTYPTRPVHWIVSFSKCGPNDIVAWLDGRTCQKNWVNNSSVNGAAMLNVTGAERGSGFCYHFSHDDRDHRTQAAGAVARRRGGAHDGCHRPLDLLDPARAHGRFPGRLVVVFHDRLFGRL